MVCCDHRTPVVEVGKGVGKDDIQWMDGLARSLTGRPYVGSSDVMTTQDLMDVGGVDLGVERVDWRKCGSCRNRVEALRRPQVVDPTGRKLRKDKRRSHGTSGKRGRVIAVVEEVQDKGRAAKKWTRFVDSGGWDE